MRELPHVSAIIKDISFTAELIDFFIENRDVIIEGWVAYPAVHDIRERLDFTLELYRSRIAENVLNYFITVLKGHNKPGDCPVMRKIVSEFHALGLTVEDVFLNCAAFKNSVLKLFDTSGSAELKSHRCDLIMVMDYNLYGVLSVYSEMKRAHEAELEFRNRIIQENVFYTRMNAEGIILEATDAFCRMCGYEKEEIIDQTHALFRHPDVEESVYNGLWETITGGEIWSGNLFNLRKDGSTFIAMTKIVPISDVNGDKIEYMVFRNDITSNELAKVDPLTGLYNRRELDNLFRNLYLGAIDSNEPLSVIVADIDHFKSINDTYGHQEGDDVIVRFAGILRSCTRHSDICSRWGGEEFVLLLPGTGLETAYEVAERIRKAAENCLKIGGHLITCSFGVAQLEKGETINELFKRADGYLYCAKSNGRNQTVADVVCPEEANQSESMLRC